jgi:hypothetical protein
MFKDLLGKPLAEKDFVVTNHNNRIVVAQVIRFTDLFVYVQPLNSTAGKRREVPPQKILRKYEYNVALIPPPDMTWAVLTNAI